MRRLDWVIIIIVFIIATALIAYLLYVIDKLFVRIVKWIIIKTNPKFKITQLSKLTTASLISIEFNSRLDFCKKGKSLSNYYDRYEVELKERDARYQDSLVVTEMIKENALDISVMGKLADFNDNPPQKLFELIDSDSIKTTNRNIAFQKRLFDVYYLPMYIETIEHQVEDFLLRQSIKKQLLDDEQKTKNRNERKLLKEIMRIELLEKGVLTEEEYIKREPIPQDVQDRVWNRDSGKCVKCGSRERIEFDHIIPFSKGGTNTYRNIQILCEKCNRSKSNKIG